ncbi:BT0820 family HAD-type phosphatase [Chishuiella sp.]|uniref:BT0820 family HAD-type phosphatase n=1 Tax=Chishuiella sp. TaxID=1969467 RepID=UPI003917E061
MLNKIIAVDFDGTIVDDKYPEIGKAKIFAFETMRQLQSEGYRLILWTYRSGKYLDEAIEFCKKNGIEFYAINNSFEEENFDKTKQSRKINADIFVDDRNLGGFPGWSDVYQIITKKIELSVDANGEKKPTKKKKRGFFGL